MNPDRLDDGTYSLSGTGSSGIGAATVDTDSVESAVRGVGAPHDRDPNFHFHYALGFATQTLAGMLDSLVRVSRRVA